MKKFIISLLLAASALALRGNTITITPAVTSDLKDLDHSSAVSWGFNLAGSGLKLGAGYKITAATISIKNINDWTIESNDKLFIDLLDNPLLGTNGQKYFSDTNDLVSDFFYETGYARATGVASPKVTRLTTFSDTNEYYRASTHSWVNPSQNFSYSLTSAQLDALTAYLGSSFNSSRQWTVGLGFDADCHYYNDGVSFTVTTSCVPDAVSTLGLLGLGTLALAGLRRFVLRG